MTLVFLIIGLGSMGKRRIRCLHSLGFFDIFGYDICKKREIDCKNEHKINILDDINNLANITTIIISTPPDMHLQYMQMAVDNNINFFVEASVIRDGLCEIIEKINSTNIIGFPSCTLLFHPAIIIIKKIIDDNILGKISNITYHSGQYLPDWHTYEKVSEYYVSKKKTGGCREIVPFEMTWLMNIFNFPKRAICSYKKTIYIEGADEIDDVYSIIFDYDDKIMNVLIDVVSRKAIRTLLINGENFQLKWNWESNFVEIYNENTTIKYDFPLMKAHNQYNKNITEEMYIDELKHFINLVNKKQILPINNLENDEKILICLEKLEKSYNDKKFIEF